MPQKATENYTELQLRQETCLEAQGSQCPVVTEQQVSPTRNRSLSLLWPARPLSGVSRKRELWVCAWVVGCDARVTELYILYFVRTLPAAH